MTKLYQQQGQDRKLYASKDHHFSVASASQSVRVMPENYCVIVKDVTANDVFLDLAVPLELQVMVQMLMSQHHYVYSATLQEVCDKLNRMLANHRANPAFDIAEVASVLFADKFE